MNYGRIWSLLVNKFHSWSNDEWESCCLMTPPNKKYFLKRWMLLLCSCLLYRSNVRSLWHHPIHLRGDHWCEPALLESEVTLDHPSVTLIVFLMLLIHVLRIGWIQPVKVLQVKSGHETILVQILIMISSLQWTQVLSQVRLRRRALISVITSA